MNGDWDLFVGDCFDGLRVLSDGEAQTCITSPPYFGLRDYGCDGQIGLELTIGEFIGRLVAVFDEVHRVLSDDGTLWLNMGDTYAGSWGAQGRPQGNGQMADRSVASARQIAVHPNFQTCTGTRGREAGCKPKDLMGIPWRLAFALQDAGWYLRQDVIWHKPNPMPESVKDRCTKAHEYIFLMSKSPRYYFDSDAIAESVTVKKSGNHARKPATERGCPADGVSGSVPWEGSTRNKRSVWTVPTKPFKEAHFATFPPELIEPCVMAGSRPGDLVIDPFAGSGTTGMVAGQHGRRFFGCELNPEYAQMACDRIEPAYAQGRLFA